MSALTLVVASALIVAAAGLLIYAGRLVERRTTTPENARAMHDFARWWFAAGAVVLLTGARTFIGVGGIVDPAAHLALAYVVGAALSVALWSLMTYLAFVITGASWPRVVLTVLYFGFFLFVTWYTWMQGGRSVTVTDWQVMLEPERPPSTGLTLLYGLLLAGPILLMVTSYIVWAFHVRDPPVRFRLLMVASGFLFLFATVLVGFVAGWTDADWFPLLWQGAAVVAAGMVVVAYRPPAGIARRLEGPAGPSGR